MQFATNEIKQNITKKNSNFFEAYLVLALDSLRKKDYEKSVNYLELSSKFIDNDKFCYKTTINRLKRGAKMASNKTSGSII